MNKFVVVLIFLYYFADAQDYVPGSGCGPCVQYTQFNGDQPNVNLYGPQDPLLVYNDAMEAAYDSVCLNIEYDTLNAFFLQSENWCYWNGLFGPVQTTDLREGDGLYAEFNIIPNVNFPNGTFLPPPSIRLVNKTIWGSTYAWIYKFMLPNGTTLQFGRHNYGIYPLPNNQSCFITWEKIAGSLSDNSEDVAAEMQKTFDCANGAALDGSRCLEYVYMNTNGLGLDNVIDTCHYWTGYGCKKSKADVTDCLPFTYPPQM